jgi:hypothetical protein
MGFKIKEKKGVEIVETLYSADLIEFIYNKIFNQINNPNIKYFYLCADLHQYQCGNVSINGKMQIKQYIVGTGGAKLDKYDKNLIMSSHNSYYNKTTNDIISTYQMSNEDLDNSTAENGFLICEKVDDDILSFKFETTDGRVIVGGKKTRKNRQKRKRKSRKNKKRSHKRK